MKNKLKQSAKMVLSFFAGMLFFVGVLSVMATYPMPPNNETIGGWLGAIFDLQNSGTGELIVQSKNVKLPNNAVISDNKQVTTKEYVDSRVVAEGNSGGGELVCVADQYAWQVCQGVDIPGYSKFMSSSGNYGCCFKKVDQGTGKRIFVTGVGYRGDLDEGQGGEEGADAKCQRRADAASLNGTFKAWLLDGTNKQYIYDKFEDRSYYNMQGGKVITTFLNYNQGPTGFNTLEATIGYDEFGRTNSRLVWTGILSGGSAFSNNCSNFTSSTSNGTVGHAAFQDSRWYYYHSSPTYGCNNTLSLICVET